MTQPDSPPEEYDEVDMDAMRRALAKMMKESPPLRQQQLQSMLEERSWVEVAQFAAFNCQIDALKLPPWRVPPSHAYDGDPTATRLLDRMLRHDISQWEPDPMSALRNSKRAARQKKRAEIKARSRKPPEGASWATASDH